MWNAATGVCLAKLEGHKGKVGFLLAKVGRCFHRCKSPFHIFRCGLSALQEKGWLVGAGILHFSTLDIYFLQTETRHGEVRVWQLPEKAQILMEGNPEERKEKDSTDQEDILKHQENESNELMGNLIEMNNSTDSKALWQKSNKQENSSKQETDIEVSQETDNEVSQERDVEVSQETDVEVSQEGRPLHHHPISTSVSGWFTLNRYDFLVGLP